MRARLNCQIFTRAKVNDLGAQWVLIDHNVVRFQVSMQDTKLLVKILHAEQDLLHENTNFILFVQSLAKATTLALDILRKTHVHHFEDNEQFAVLELNALRLHHIRAVGAATLSVNLVEPLQNLDLALVKGLLLALKLILEAFNRIVFA